MWIGDAVSEPASAGSPLLTPHSSPLPLPLQEQTSLGAIVKKAAAASYAQAISLADGAQVVAKELSEGNTTRLQATANQVGLAWQRPFKPFFFQPCTLARLPA